jgi:hypothetical protein
MCALRGSLTIVTSIPNEARFSLESKKSDPVQGSIRLCSMNARFTNFSVFERESSTDAPNLTRRED